MPAGHSLDPASLEIALTEAQLHMRDYEPVPYIA
jgi:hypothetical protein